MKKFFIIFFLVAFIASALCMNFSMSRNEISLSANLKDMLVMNKANAEYTIDYACSVFCVPELYSMCITRTFIDENPYISCPDMYN